MLAAVYIPMTTDSASIGDILSNFSSLTVNQVSYLYANVNTAATMEIPFNTPLNYLDVEDLTTSSAQGSLGYVYIVVFNPLEAAATATTTVDVSVFSQLYDNSFKLPRFSQPLATQSKKKVDSSSFLSKALKAVLPPFTIHDVLDKAFNFLGLHKPTNIQVDPPTKILGSNFMNAGDGIEYIDKMCIFPSHVPLVSLETFATENDEMALDDLKSRFTYLGSFSQSVSQGPGSVLATLPMNPTPKNMFTGASNTLPLLSYLSLPFSYWKGGLTYKLQVISTSFQTAKLFIAFNYGNFNPASVNISQMTGQYGEAFEINQGSNEFVFTLPYISKYHQLFVPNSNNPTELDSMGLIRFVVLNSLVSPNNTPTTIHFNLFLAGSSDYALSALAPSNNVVPYSTLGVPLRTQSAIAPMNSSMVNTYKEADESVLAPNDQLVKRVDIGEHHVDNLRHVLRKYQFSRRILLPQTPVPESGPTDSPSYQIIDLMEIITSQQPSRDPIEASALGHATTSTGLMGHFSSLYRMFNGSLRLKIALEACPSNSSFSVFYMPCFPYDNTFTSRFDGFDEYVNSQLLPQAILDQPFPPSGLGSISTYSFTRLPISFVNGVQKTAEFEIPYNSNFQSLLTRDSVTEPYLFSDPISNLGYVVIVPHPFNGTPLGNFPAYADVFVSLGDETRFGTLYRVPRVVPSFHFTSPVAYNDIWPDDYNVPLASTYTLTTL
jgi:hypothetical protein